MPSRDRSVDRRGATVAEHSTAPEKDGTSTPKGNATASTATPRRRFLAGATTVAGLGAAGALHLNVDRDDSPASIAGADPDEPTPTQAPTTTEPPATETDAPTVLGANLNGRPRRVLDAMELVEDSGTTWVRAFLDVRRSVDGGVAPADDPDVLALRRLAELGCRLAVSLKWDFAALWGDKPPRRVPRPGSSTERALFGRARDLLAAVDAPIDVVVLGNEPMWETPGADLVGADPRVVRFTRRAKDVLVERGDHGDPVYLAGALNRADDEAVRTDHYGDIYRAMTAFVREDQDVAGVDLHVHFTELAQVQAALLATRETFPTEVVTVTEFSPVFRYEEHVHEPIDASEAGARFANEHGLPAGTTAVDYFEDAKRDPRTAGELADFYAAMPWYNVDHVADVHAVLSAYDVALGTFGLLQDAGMRHADWRDGWEPFHINFLYQAALTDDAGGIVATGNRHYLEDYRRLSGEPGAGIRRLRPEAATNPGDAAVPTTARSR